MALFSKTIYFITSTKLPINLNISKNIQTKISQKFSENLGVFSNKEPEVIILKKREVPKTVQIKDQLGVKIKLGNGVLKTLGLVPLNTKSTTETMKLRRETYFLVEFYHLLAMAGEKCDNLTAVLYGINDLRLEQRPIPTPNDDDVLLKMEVVGICGSDVHYLVHGRIGDFVVEKPMVIGHEASGTVVEVGKNVTNLKKGDRVAIEPGYGCRKCTYCKEGRYNLCPDMIFCATPPFDGNLARYYTHPADFCFKLPDNVSFEEGALLEPLSVGVHACKKGGVGVGSVVLILGAGPIGLVTLISAKAFGATKVIIADLVESRLEVAKCLGADHVLQICRNDDEQKIIKNIKDALGCEPVISMDCSGVESSVRVALLATKSGGTVVFVGMGKSEMNIPITSILIREVDVKGVFRYVNDYQTSLDLVASEKIDVKPLITHQYQLEDTLEAFETSRTGRGNAIKVLIYPNKDWVPSNK